MQNLQNRFDLVKAIAAVDADIAQMEEYLQLKIKQRDWHGVADAAMDIREMESYKRALQSVGFG